MSACETAGDSGGNGGGMGGNEILKSKRKAVDRKGVGKVRVNEKERKC